MDRNIASKYIHENFKPSDRLAIVLLDKRNDAVIQRIATAEHHIETYQRVPFAKAAGERLRSQRRCRIRTVFARRPQDPFCLDHRNRR